MALMFQRLAHNYAKNGYYPTDAETTQRILCALKASPAGTVTILDPCCGEGVALAELKHHLGAHRTQAFGIEYNLERAWSAKELLDMCIHADIQDCMIGARQFGALFLNPPYGDLVKDGIHTRLTGKGKGRLRLEKLFYSIAYPTLQFGGVLVLIVPYTSLDSEFSAWISRHFDNVQAYLAPEQAFKQVVVFGIRRRVEGVGDATVKNRLIAIGEGELPDELPVVPGNPYIVPAAPSGLSLRLETYKLDRRQLEEACSQNPGLWPQFATYFGHQGLRQRPPLCPLSDWHLALALAAGQLQGKFTTKQGRTLLVKGNTYKVKQRIAGFVEGEDGRLLEEIVLKDVFTPVIRAIDIGKGDTYGDIITIQ